MMEGQFMSSEPVSSMPPQVNTVAIVALVLAFVVPPAGLVLGIVGRYQIARSGERGAGLAVLAIIIGAAVTLLYALPFLLTAPDILQHML